MSHSNNDNLVMKIFMHLRHIGSCNVGIITFAHTVETKVFSSIKSVCHRNLRWILSQKRMQRANKSRTVGVDRYLNIPHRYACSLRDYFERIGITLDDAD